MAETPTAQRLRLFDRYSRNFSLSQPEYQDIFACPLCQEGFCRLSLAGDNPEVNLAHVIPASLGGTLCTLTCSKCNSRGGTDLESALAERFDAEDVVAGVGRVRGRMSGLFGDVGVEWQLSPDWKSHSVYCVPQQSNPAHLTTLYRYLDEQTSRPDGDMKFSIMPDYDHRPAQVEAAVYQSAFLLMFSYFGYEFAFHPFYQPLREQILRPEEKIWRTRIVLPTDESAQALLGQHRQAVMFNSEPPAILAFLRFLRPKGLGRVLAVVLPGLDDPSPVELGEGTKHGSIIPYRPQALASTKFYFRKMWNFVQKNKKPNGPHVDPQGQGADSPSPA